MDNRKRSSSSVSMQPAVSERSMVRTLSSPASLQRARRVLTPSPPSSLCTPTSMHSPGAIKVEPLGWNPYYTPSSAAALALALAIPSPPSPSPTSPQKRLLPVALPTTPTRSNRSKDIPLIVSSLDKPFPCTHCPKRFKRQEHLRRHVRTHTEERPFHCDVCERSFSRSDNLRAHKRTHAKRASTDMTMITPPPSEGPIFRYLRPGVSPLPASDLMLTMDLHNSA